MTLVELVIVVGILATLAAMTVPLYTDAIEKARVIRAIADMRTLEKEIVSYQLVSGGLPDTLTEIGRGNLLDSWGKPYEYLKFCERGGRGGSGDGDRRGRDRRDGDRDCEGQMGMMRKDRFLVPLNSTYDLYSRGRDGESRPPLTARESWDDIVRANDGGFVGLASEY